MISAVFAFIDCLATFEGSKPISVLNLGSISFEPVSSKY